MLFPISPPSRGLAFTLIVSRSGEDMIFDVTSCNGLSLTPLAVREFAALITYYRVSLSNVVSEYHKAIHRGDGIVAVPTAAYYERIDSALAYVGANLMMEFDRIRLDLCRQWVDANMEDIVGKRAAKLTASPQELNNVTRIVDVRENSLNDSGNGNTPVPDPATTGDSVDHRLPVPKGKSKGRKTRKGRQRDNP